ASIKGSSLAHAITLNGQGQTALFGVTTGATSSDGSQLEFVTIKNFLQAGMSVVTRTATILAGVTITGNGTAPARAPRVIGAGAAAAPGHLNILNATPASATTSISSNTQHGIIVLGHGSITLNGSPAGTVPDGGTFSGTVVVNDNYVAGIFIQQTPGATQNNS